MQEKNVHFDLKQCLECGKELNGRMDKKYCDTSCKSAYHNRHKNSGEAYIRQSHRILRRNRSILRTLSPEGKATVRKEVLEKMGYDFLYFSGLYKSQKSSLLYYLVYDYGFAPIFEKNIEKALIINKQAYMDHPSFPIWRK